MLEVLLISSLGLVIYTYFIYPAILGGLSRIVGRKPIRRHDYMPTVSLIIAAHNEERVIDEKLRNCLSIDYPNEKLEIIIASDGSDDATNEIVRRYTDRGIILQAYSRGGKVATLNKAVSSARHEFIVFSDANTMYKEDAIRRLMEYFGDDKVGAVTGDVRLVNDDKALAESEGIYFRYERYIQARESELRSVIGVDGAMYAIRRTLYEPIPVNVVCDDFVIAMNILRSGHRVVYASNAVAYEESTSSIPEEMRRRTRYTAATMQALFSGQGLPRASQYGLWAMYLSHKVLRWNAPFLLLAVLVLNALCLHTVLLKAMFVGQCCFYLTAFVAWFNAGHKMPLFARVPLYFTLQNIASFIGVCRAICRRQGAAWRSPVRSGCSTLHTNHPAKT